MMLGKGAVRGAGLEGLIPGGSGCGAQGWGVCRSSRAVGGWGALTGARGSAGLCRGSGLSPSRPLCPPCPSPRAQAGTMAQVGHRVDYLAGFCCPVGGLVAGKPRVLCHENEIYLSNGTEFVYVYDQEGKVLKVRGLAGWGGHPVSPVPWGQCPVTEWGHPPVTSPLPLPDFPPSGSSKQTPQAAPFAVGFGGAAPSPWDQTPQAHPPSAGISPPGPARCPRCHSTLSDTLLPLLICSDYHF